MVLDDSVVCGDKVVTFLLGQGDAVASGSRRPLAALSVVARRSAIISAGIGSFVLIPALSLGCGQKKTVYALCQRRSSHAGHTF